MNSKKETAKKATGKDLAKVNLRKRFYKRLDSICSRVQKEKLEDNPILLMLKKQRVFPKFEEFTSVMETAKDIQDLERDQIDILEKIQTLNIPFIDEGYFFKKMGDKKFITIIRQETHLDEKGNIRKGVTTSENDDDSYNYQVAFNWLIKLTNIPKLQEFLIQEMEEPTEYVIKERAQGYRDVFKRRRYRKDYRIPRRRPRK